MINKAHNETSVTDNDPEDDDSITISLMDPDIPMIVKVMAIPYFIAGGVIFLLMAPVLILAALFSGRVRW